MKDIFPNYEEKRRKEKKLKSKKKKKKDNKNRFPFIIYSSILPFIHFF